MSTLQHEQSLRAVVDFFQTISPASLAQFDRIYAADVRFKDPFNEVQGLAATIHIFEHMFTQVDAPRFVVTTSVLQGDDAFLTWDFLFRMRRFPKEEQCIKGATHLRFNAQGLVVLHRDYWDAAEELYEKLPVLGGLMRVLKSAARK